MNRASGEKKVSVTTYNHNFLDSFLFFLEVACGVDSFGNLRELLFKVHATIVLKSI